MKILTLLLISIVFANISFADIAPPKKDKAMCKLFTDKAKKYKKTMRNDSYAEVTLHSYEHRASLYCPNKK